jgi:uncharacterized membrane protein
MRCPTLRTRLALALALLAGPALAATPAPGWTITDLGRYEGRGLALNDNGWVVFGNRILAPGAGGSVTTTTLVSGDGSLNNLWLRDINNANAVLGVDASVSAAHGFVWQAGVRTALPDLANFNGYRYSDVAAINDAGQIAGNTGDIAYRWSSNGSGGYLLTGLGVDLGWTTGSGSAAAINSAGAVLLSQVYDSYRTGYSFGIDHTSIIPELPGYQPVGLALNDQYQVAGYGVYNCGGYSCNRPFVWQGPEVAWLPVAVAATGWSISGEARGLNESGQVVGGAYVAGYDRRAFLWTLGAGGWSATDMNTLIPAGSPFWHLADAIDINERGQIVGLGSVAGDNSGDHVFLLTPVPEPAPAALLLAGLLSLGLLRRRRR